MTLARLLRSSANAALMIGAGLAWMSPGPIWWLGPLSSLALPLVVPTARRKSHRFFLSFSYFAAGSLGLVPGSGVFFGAGPASYALGAAFWMSSAALLALPWAWADARRPWTALAALAVDVLPPLGLFGWLSPLAAAGVLWPGTGAIGVAALIGMVWAWHRRRDAWAKYTLAGLAALAVTALGSPSPPRPDIAGIDTYFGKLPVNPMAQIARNAQIIAMAAKSPARIVVLPETLVNWLPGTAAQFQAAIPPGKTWLIGATTFIRGGEMADSIIEVRHNRPPRTVFNAALPVPVSMWHPWKNGGYKAVWREPARQIDGNRTTAIICYDQLLAWPWIEVTMNQPAVILATQNEWWAVGTGIPLIQTNTARAWSRLIGARLALSANR